MLIICCKDYHPDQMLYLLPAGWNTESPPNLQLRPESVKEFVFVFVIVCVFKWVFVFLYLYLSLYFSKIQFSFFPPVCRLHEEQHSPSMITWIITMMIIMIMMMIRMMMILSIMMIRMNMTKS